MFSPPIMLVTGGSGLVGSNISILAREKYQVVTTWYANPFNISGCIIERLDITDQTKCRDLIKKYNPDYIIHSAISYKNLGACEHDVDGFHKVGIFDATVNVAKACQEIGAKMIFISTDWVFNGQKPKGLKYSEDETPSPSLNYGALKFKAEQFLSKNLDDYIIIRVAFVYGHNYAKACSTPFWSEKNVRRNSGVVQIASLLRTGEVVYQPGDVYQSPTYAPDIGRAVINLCENNSRGLFHVAGSDSVSRYQFFRTLAESFDLEPDLVKEQSLKKFLSLRGNLAACPEIIDRFPVNTGLDTSKLKKTVNFFMRGYKEGLKDLTMQISKISEIR